MKIHLIGAGDPYARRNHEKTINKNVSTDLIRRFIKDKNVISLLERDSYAVWGIKNASNNINHKKWLKMIRGDICLFHRDNNFFCSGKVITKFKNIEFATHLWKDNEATKLKYADAIYENMFVMDEIKKISIPKKTFNIFMGNSEVDSIQQYRVYDESTSEKIIDEFQLHDWQTPSHYDPSLSSKDNKKRIQNLLDNLTSTDTTSSGGQSRKEQSLHREHHFGNKLTAKCSLCHRELPTTILHAGHIKPRRNCNEEERKDLNVTMPVCKLGCDDLFEKGYIYVDASGSIIINDTREIPSELRNFLKIYDGKKCLHFNEETKDYFESKNKDVL